MKPANITNHCGEIIKGYKQQYYCYQQLLKQAQELNNISFDKDMEKLQRIIKEREEIITKINQIDSTVKMHKEAIKSLGHLREFTTDSLSGLIPNAILQDLLYRIELLEKIIQSIQVTDQKNEQQIRNKMNAIKSELKKIRQHHQIKNTYLDSSEQNVEPRCFDKTK